MAHECSWDSVEWSKEYYVAGLGETLERKGKCSICGRTFREVYLHSCLIDEETEEDTTL